MSTVTLCCVKEGSKLRVKITTQGYIRYANCQFPRDIRVEGRTYTVPASAIRLVSGPQGRYFYKIEKKAITIVADSTATATAPHQPVHVYGDEEPTCIICMDAPKTLVFVPCGHYCACSACTPNLYNKCPMCRETIVATIGRDQVE